MQYNDWHFFVAVIFGSIVGIFISGIVVEWLEKKIDD